MVRNNMVEALWVDCDNRAKVGWVGLLVVELGLVVVVLVLVEVLTRSQAIGDLASSVRSQYIGQMAEQFQVGVSGLLVATSLRDPGLSWIPIPENCFQNWDRDQNRVLPFSSCLVNHVHD